MTSQLESLKQFTTVVADTGDIESIIEYRPEDATTNPSLILSAARMDKYAHLAENAVVWAKRQNSTEWIEIALDRIAVSFGMEMLKLIPGRVSTEVDAALSFDTEATITKARQIIQLYESEGIGRERVLIKIASTWEGIQAATVLEKEGIHCNLTLLFNLAQAIACAEAGAYLISPFVGRILDWHKAKTGSEYSAKADPGVISVASIYHYYKRFNYPTIVMGASFRNVGEIIELTGCDRLTISPTLLEHLSTTTGALTPRLTPEAARNQQIGKIQMNEPRFRWMMNEDAMATEKLSEGIRKFNADLIELRSFLNQIE
ncbi:MAG: transaldolase [Gammaproteobacteria bacterium]|nr:transaldolase [Gammaproteobacteria bacterium]